MQHASKTAKRPQPISKSHSERNAARILEKGRGELYLLIVSEDKR
jgi:hypothetical protein